MGDIIGNLLEGLEQRKFSRRQLVQNLAQTAGLLFVGCAVADAAFGAIQTGGKPKRREVTVAGRRVRTIDVHSHCFAPEVWDLVKDHEKVNPVDEGGGDHPTDAGRLLSLHNLQDRLAQMDERGIDMSALSVNPPYYWPDRDLARQITKVQNEKLAEVCAAHPDRFVGLGTVALQHPDLAAEQLEDGVKKLGMRGVLIGGSVNGEEISDPKFHPFWAKAEELGTLVFIHPQTSIQGGQARFKGNGWLANVIGQPLETTFALSHLIFEGTLDRFPGLKICLAHAGGYLPSHIGRAEQCSSHFTARDRCAPIKKHPSEYLKQLYYDTLIFTDEGLRHLIAEVGVSQIMLGSDAPGDWDPHAVDFVLRTSGLSDAERRNILSGSAEKLLRIS